MIFDSEKFLNLEITKKYNTFQKTFKNVFQCHFSVSPSLESKSELGVPDG